MARMYGNIAIRAPLLRSLDLVNKTTTRRATPSRVVPSLRTLATGPTPPPAPTPTRATAADITKPPTPEFEEPPKGGFRQRLRAIMTRYGWWAVGVYLVVGTVDLSMIFAFVHFYGGDKVREMEHTVRGWFGLAKKEVEDALQNAPSPDTEKPRPLVAPQQESTDMQELIRQLSAEFVLAYGIHKTLLLPPRAAITAAITPSVVRWLARRGWKRAMQAAVGPTATNAAKQVAP